MISAYALGRGYRFFSPSLMRFQTPDAHSPFGKGGLNSYAFCLGDPVNYSDPTGQWGERITGFLKRLGRDRRPPHTIPEARLDFIKAQEAFREELDNRYFVALEERLRKADVAHEFMMKNAHVYPVMKGIFKHLKDTHAGVMPGTHPGNMAEMTVQDIARYQEHIEHFNEIAAHASEKLLKLESHGSPQEIQDQVAHVEWLRDVIQEKQRNIRRAERTLSWLRGLS